VIPCTVALSVAAFFAPVLAHPPQTSAIEISVEQAIDTHRAFTIYLLYLKTEPLYTIALNYLFCQTWRIFNPVVAVVCLS